VLKTKRRTKRKLFRFRPLSIAYFHMKDSTHPKEEELMTQSFFVHVMSAVHSLLFIGTFIILKMSATFYLHQEA